MYPNLYVIFISDSAFLRRSVSQKIGINGFFRKLPDVRVFSDRLTAEGVIDNITRVVRLPSGQQREEATALIWAPELPLMFGADDTSTRRAAIFLTDVYEGKKEHQHTTRGHGLQKLHNLVISFLGSSAPDWLEKLPEEMIGGGFTGRIFFVTADKRKRPIAWPTLSQSEQDLGDLLMKDLQDISNTIGEMKPSKACYDRFTTWYENDLAKMKLTPTLMRAKPFFERIHDHAMKLAMVLSISESDSLIVELHHLEKAIKICMALLKEMPETIKSLGANPFSLMSEKIYDTMVKHGGDMQHSILLRMFSWKLTAADFKIAMNTLIEENRVRVKPGNKKLSYEVVKQP